MARLSHLIAGYAAALQVPPNTVNNVAAVMRLSKLLTTGPRGPGAPHMAPTDATNLLLGVMYDAPQEAAGVNVPRLRDAELVSCRGNIGFDYGGGTAKGPPPHSCFARAGSPYRLGDVLDAMLDELVRFGDLDEEPEEGTDAALWTYATNISFSVTRPGHRAELFIDSTSVHWHLSFAWPDPEYPVRRAAELARGEMPSHSLAHLGPHMASTRMIGDAELQGIADALRGQRMPEGPAELEDFQPAYDPAPAAAA